MHASERPGTLSDASKPGIRWGRIAVAAVLAEVATILTIGAVIIVHKLWIAPGQSDAEARAFGEIAGYYAGRTRDHNVTTIKIVPER